MALIGAVSLVGCAGKVEFTRPNIVTIPDNVKTVNRSRDQVWNAAIPALGKQFFVINNLDKSSGLVNVSYTGAPENYIDCGHYTSYVKNAQGERTYSFPGASANQTYEIMDPQQGLFKIHRRLEVEGRVNLVFEQLGPLETRVSANTRYVITRKVVIQHNNQTSNSTDSISFNSRGGASFPAAGNGQSTQCLSNGVLEADILKLIN